MNSSVLNNKDITLQQFVDKWKLAEKAATEYCGEIVDVEQAIASLVGTSVCELLYEGEIDNNDVELTFTFIEEFVRFVERYLGRDNKTEFPIELTKGKTLLALENVRKLGIIKLINQIFDESPDEIEIANAIYENDFDLDNNDPAVGVRHILRELAACKDVGQPRSA